MLDKITTFIHEISHSTDFTYIHEQGSPADAASLGDLEDAFKKLGHKVPPSLLQFYRLCDGFTLRWTYKKLTHPDYITSGDTQIVGLAQLLSTIQHAPTEPVLFDYVSDINQVLLRVGKKQLTLLYHDEYERKDFPMSVDIDEYFRLLDESRGLYPWCELLIKSKSFRLEPVLRDKFFADLNLLFKDANPASFNQT